jgi:DNA-directed RNA polymerase subunit M/transcription elongation factor TFIIS
MAEEKNIITVPVEGLSQLDAAKCIREVAEILKNKIFKKSESKCPKCGETNRMASHLIGQDNPDVFHRICIRCKHVWDTKEAS